MGTVFWQSMRQLTGRWRLILILLLAALPVALAAIVHFAASDDDSFREEFIDILLDGMLPHGSAANRSNLSRHAYSLHVIDGTCRYLPENWLQRGPEMPLRGFS